MGFGSAKICAPVQEGLVHSALCVFSLGEILLQTFERLEMDVERASEILCHSRALGWEEDASLVTDLCPQRESRETGHCPHLCPPSRSWSSSLLSSYPLQHGHRHPMWRDRMFLAQSS